MDKQAVLFSATANMNISIIYVPPGNTAFSDFVQRNAGRFYKNGVEVIIGVLQDVNAEAIVHDILQYPLINWKVISSSTRSITSMFNSCIGHAVKANVLIMNPTADLNDDTLKDLKYYSFHYHRTFFCISSQTQPGGREIVPDMLFLSRQQVDLIGKFDASMSWQGAFVQAIKKLQRSGLKCFKFTTGKKSDKNPASPDSNILKPAREIFYPLPNAKLIQPDNTPVATVHYSWAEGSFGYQRCSEYLKQFRQSEIKSKDCFSRHYRVIVLLQTYNEMRNMPDILRHLETYSDGIILLDDQSTDGTFENVVSDKLLLKVQKKRVEFDDIGNRNILLDLVSFFKADWIYTLDADERIDPRYDDIFGATNSQADILSFYYVNLWNDPATYRVDYSTSDNRDGIFHRRRMYRNIGRAQIHLMDEKKLHFNPVPLIDNTQRVKILILHHGTLDSNQRKNKFDFYLAEDASKVHFDTYYKFLTDGEAVVDKVENIRI
jgi:hypothetical protein